MFGITKSGFLLFAISFPLWSLQFANAAIAPPNTPVQLQISMANSSVLACLSAAGVDNGSEVVIIDCDRTFPSDHTWTIVEGSSTAASGTGPASQIRIFGDKCLDVTNGVDANGNKLQIWECVDGNTNQLFNANTSPDGPTITWNTHREKCVDLTGGDLAQNTPVQIFNCGTNNPNQKWVPVAQPPIELRIIKNTAGGTISSCITASNSANGSPVVIGNCGSSIAGQNQSWAVPVSGFGIISTFNNKCLDVTNGVDASGTKLQVWDCVEGDANQLWSVNIGGVVVDGGTAIQWAGTAPGKTTRCVDLTGGSDVPGTPIQIWTCQDENENQDWFQSISF